MKKLTLFALLMSFTSTCLGWGQTGHRVSGAIAEHYLSAEAKAQIAKILVNQDLAEVSTYADEMRSNPSEFWQKTASPFHYVTVPPGTRYSVDNAPEQGDAVTALMQFRKTLLDNNASLEDKRLALNFTVHIIADLHQPLHAGNGKDRGGNDVEVEFFWQKSNLHRVWDSGLIDNQQLSFTEWTNWLHKKISKQQAYEWMDPDPATWIRESTEIRDTIYPESDRLSWDYQYQHLPTVKLRLQQAGVRIAAYLNELYSISSGSGDRITPVESAYR